MRIATTGTTLAWTSALLLMVFMGYQLAAHKWHDAKRRVDTLFATNAALKLENQQLREEVGKLTLERDLAQGELTQTRDSLKTLQQKRQGLENQLGFYQHVMAPELTQDGFNIEGVQIVQTASEQTFRLTAVLLQQQRNKAVIKGDMQIAVIGVQNERPVTLTSGEQNFLPEGPIFWRFKYFQTLDLSFTLPDGFIPEQLRFYTDVYQWRSKRGEYSKTLQWEEALEKSKHRSVTE